MVINTISFLHTHQDRITFKYYAKVFDIKLGSTGINNKKNTKKLSTIDLENLLKFKKCIEQQIIKIEKDFKDKKILLIKRNAEFKKYRQMLNNINKGIKIIKEQNETII